MIEDLKRRYQRLADRIDTLSLRERAMIFVAVMAVLLFVAAKLIIGPLDHEQKVLEKKIRAENQQFTVVNAQIQKLAADYGHDPNAANRARLADLKRRLVATKAALGARTQGLVSPTDMVRLVEQVLKRNRSLKLEGVESLPSTALFDRHPMRALGIPAVPKTTAPAPGVHLYKHGMRIQLRGRYREIVAYLQALERLPWKVFWGRVTLQVATYPESVVTLDLYTLSRQSGWIGL